MLVDADKIISDTINVFDSTKEIRERFHGLDKISNEDYKSIHPTPLVKTSLEFHSDLLEKQLERYTFSQWGKHHSNLPRYGIALVNQSGELLKNDPINGSLYEWNCLHLDNPIIESDCRTPTELLYLSSLNELRVFDNHWCRSNILKWKSGARFMPHIDTTIPAYWIRLWGTTNDNVVVRFHNGREMVPYHGIEPGVVYIIDTSIVHDAFIEHGEAYQLFLAVMPSALEIIRKVI